MFGRVTPQQKLKFVQALKDHGHTVAMTGDGVNDVLALKEADCSIAMASGSDAARTVSNLVFARLQLCFHAAGGKGRQALHQQFCNALHRCFSQKTIYSTVLGVLFIFLSASYPFEPIQLTFISSITIGIPSFILVAGAEQRAYKRQLFSERFEEIVPLCPDDDSWRFVLTLFKGPLNLTNPQVSTLSVIVAFAVGLC